MVTLQTADGALKSFYLDALKREIDDKVSPFLAQIEKTTANVAGKSVRKLVKTGIYGGVGAGTETGDLPTGDSSDIITLTAPLKNLYGTIEISDKAIRASASNEGAFVNLLNEEMQGLVKSAKYNFSRMLFGDGNGYLARVTSTNGRSVLYLDTMKAIEEGMYIDIYDMGKKIVNKAKIAFIDKVENRVELFGMHWDEDDAPGDQAEVYIHGAEEGYELTGLGALFSDREIYEMDRGKEYMRPYIMQDVGYIDLGTLEEAIDSVEERGGSKVNFIFCSWKVKRCIMQLARENNVQLTTKVLSDNSVVSCYNGIPLVADRFCPEGVIYLLNTDDFKICQLCDWQWMEGEDGKILKQVPGKPVYTATLVKYAELVCEKPCGQGMLAGITV